MNDIARMQMSSQRSPSPQTVAIIMTAIALLTPFLFAVMSYVEGEIIVQISANTWSLQGLHNIYQLNFDFAIQASLAPFSLLRLFFVQQMFRYYQVKMNRKRLLLVGFISELQVAVLFIISYLAALGGPAGVVFIGGPIPVLLLSGILLLVLIPPPKPTREWLNDEMHRSDLK